MVSRWTEVVRFAMTISSRRRAGEVPFQSRVATGPIVTQGRPASGRRVVQFRGGLVISRRAGLLAGLRHGRCADVKLRSAQGSLVLMVALIVLGVAFDLITRSRLSATTTIPCEG